MARNPGKVTGASKRAPVKLKVDAQATGRLLLRTLRFCGTPAVVRITPKDIRRGLNVKEHSFSLDKRFVAGFHVTLRALTAKVQPNVENLRLPDGREIRNFIVFPNSSGTRLVDQTGPYTLFVSDGANVATGCDIEITICLRLNVVNASVMVAV